MQGLLIQYFHLSGDLVLQLMTVDSYSVNEEIETKMFSQNFFHMMQSRET